MNNIKEIQKAINKLPTIRKTKKIELGVLREPRFCYLPIDPCEIYNYGFGEWWKDE